MQALLNPSKSITFTDSESKIIGAFTSKRSTQYLTSNCNKIFNFSENASIMEQTTHLNYMDCDIYYEASYAIIINQWKSSILWVNKSTINRKPILMRRYRNKQLAVSKLVKIFLALLTSKIEQCSGELGIEHHPEAFQFSPHQHTLFLYDPF
jgi:hypothetical protein